VKLGIDKSNDSRVAVKQYEKYKLYDTQKKKNIQREISILQKVNHPHIIKLFKTIDTTKHVTAKRASIHTFSFSLSLFVFKINLVMEYTGSSSLHSYIRMHPSKKLPEGEAKRIFK